MTSLRIENIYHWYEIVNEYKKSGLSLELFSKEKNIPCSKLSHYNHIFGFVGRQKSSVKNRILAACNEYDSKPNLTIKFISEKYSISPSTIKTALADLKYTEIIEGVNKEKSEKMNFITIHPQEKKMEVEIISKKNDIELSIKEGIKIICSPEVSSEKIVMIIEFLKGF